MARDTKPGLGINMALDGGGDHVVSVAPTLLGNVAGGAGFVAVSGAVVLDVGAARQFHHDLTGNLSGLSFTNVPTGAAFRTDWTWVLRIDATAGRTLAGLPSVTWVDGGSWDDVNLAPNALNIIAFWQIDTVTYAAMISNGSLAFDPYKMCFLEDATYLLPTENETLDLGSANATRVVGDGAITYRKNAVATDITGVVTFVVGDYLRIICTGMTTATAVRIPRYTS